MKTFDKISNLIAVIRVLNDTDREILTQSLGIVLCKPKKMGAIGRELGLSRERVRQIRDKIAERIEDLINKDNLTL